MRRDAASMFPDVVSCFLAHVYSAGPVTSNHTHRAYVVTVAEWSDRPQCTSTPKRARHMGPPGKAMLQIK